MTLRIHMVPNTASFQGQESGIKRICEALEKHLPTYDLQFVGPDNYDLLLDHAGALNGQADVTLCAGLYWTGSPDSGTYTDGEYKANANVIKSLISAREIIVPSHWVATNIARGLRVYPHVIPHGLDVKSWQHHEPDQGYILWAKNRVGDVCNPQPWYDLAKKFPQLSFVSTFLPTGQDKLSNTIVTGVRPHDQMKKMIQRCGVYLSTSKETYGIATLEAMAAGRPVLGWAQGGNLDLVQHGVTGYLAEPGNQEDLEEGLLYCLTHAKTLGANGQASVQNYTWTAACERIAEVCYLAKNKIDAPDKVVCVIPCHNYGAKVGRAIESVLKQTQPVAEIVVIDDASDDNSREVIKSYADLYPQIHTESVQFRNVARVRNLGVELSTGQYIFTLDADDAVEPRFVEKLLPVLKSDRSLGVVYSRLRYIDQHGNEGISSWPGHWNFDQQLSTQNQVPTCSLFRREMWQRLGGYSPWCCQETGAGYEDADFYLRAGEYGWQARLIDEPLFIYSLGTGQVSGRSNAEIVQFMKDETDYYSAWYPWYTDHLHPFASCATPKRYSHPVPQYDEPLVSIIIPVGPNHEETLLNALRSIEAQTYRYWELIVCWDSPNPIPDYYRDTYPFAKFIPAGQQGAGHARNVGAEAATAPLLLFLDADDWLYPEFLEKCLLAYDQTHDAIYTDYVGKALVKDKKFIERMKQEGRLLHYDGEEVVLLYKSFNFDCERALREPSGHDFYVWCNITTLHPKAWWAEVGGFDESMPSWEDWDYFLRLVRRGHYFTRVEEPLMVYRFYTGSRRDEAHRKTKSGRHMYENLIKYLQDKYSVLHAKEGTVPCGGCNQKKSISGVTVSMPTNTYPYREEVTAMNDTEMVLIEYHHANTGDHWVTSPSGLAHEGNRAGYGMHVRGDRFPAYVADVKLLPLNFIVVGVTPRQEVITRSEVKIVAPPPPPPPPVSMVNEDVTANMQRLQDNFEESKRKMLADMAAKKVDLSDVIVEDKPVKRKGGRPKKVA